MPKPIEIIDESCIDWDKKEVIINGKKYKMRKISIDKKTFFIRGKQYKWIQKSRSQKYEERKREMDKEDKELLKAYNEAIENKDMRKATDIWIKMMNKAELYRRKNPQIAYPPAPEWEVKLINKLKERETHK